MIYQAIEDFEKSLAEFTGAKYCVVVDTCSAAIFLCCKYVGVEQVTIPRKTYCSVPASIIHAGGKVKIEDLEWKGIYQLKPYKIYDAALRFCSGMYIPDSLMCLSFQYRKHLPIGRGGAILTDCKEARDWFKLASFHGREAYPVGDGDVKMIGWSMYMEPERAARGLILLSNYTNQLDLDIQYPDLTSFTAYKNLELSLYNE